MLRVVIQRLLHAVGFLLLLSLLVFALSRAVPGDIWTELETNPSISAATLRELRSGYGLDRPIPVQYFRWLGQVLTGNLGYSPVERQPIAPLVRFRLSRTLALALTTMMLTVAASLLLCFAALKRNQLQRWVDSTALPLLLAFPTILICLLMNWIRIGLIAPARVLDTENAGSAVARLLWPAISLAIPLTAFLARQMRREISRIVEMPYSVLSRAKGLPPWYLFRNAVAPAVAVFLNLAGFLLASLMGGAVLAETVFDFPGLGLLTWNAMTNRDTFMLAAGVLSGCAAVIAINLVVDLLAVWIDPRLRRLPR